MSKLKRTLINGTVWSVSGQMASLTITLFTNIWLARLLSPIEFGQMAVVMFFVIIANVLTESGLGGALVRKVEASQIDYSTVFVFNLALSVLGFFLIWFISGSVADFYSDPIIGELLVASSLVLVINAFQFTQNVKLIRQMRFKRKSIYRFVAVLISSVIGVFYAYNGLGVWSLVLIQLLTALINTMLLWFFEGFMWRFSFSKTSFTELYGFGINTTLASLLNTVFANIYQLVLGKYFSITQTGYFYQAKKLQDVPGSIINTVSQSVVFSSLTKLQDDKEAFRVAYNKVTLYFLVALGFISAFLYFYAELLITLLYGEKWLGAVFYMQILTIASFFYIQENINRVIFKVFNQTRKILHLEIFKKLIQSVSIVLGILYLDFHFLLYGYVLTHIIGYMVNYYYSRKIIGSIKMFELYTVIKISIVSILSVLIAIIMASILKLEGVFLGVLFPVLLFVYVIGIGILKVINVRKELGKIMTSINRKSIEY